MTGKGIPSLKKMLEDILDEAGELQE